MDNVIKLPHSDDKKQNDTNIFNTEILNYLLKLKEQDTTTSRKSSESIILNKLNLLSHRIA